MSSPTAMPARHPWAVTFGQPSQSPFLEDQRGSWSVDRILSLAGGISRALPERPGVRVAVRSRSAAFLVASLLAGWQRRVAPLLLDPDVGPETSWRDGLENIDLTLVPEWEQHSPVDCPVPEPPKSGQVDFSAAFPGDYEDVISFLTSGSTGQPKVVLKKDFQFQRQSDVEPAALGLSGPIRTVSLVPAHHILGYIYGIQLPARTAGSAVFQPGASPYAWEEAIRRYRPTVVVGVPLHYRLLGQAVSEPLPEALYISSGGMLPAAVGDIFRERAGWPILQVYGSTEAAGIATRVGFGTWTPLPGVEWMTTDADRLAIRSPWQDPPDTWHVLDDAVEEAEDGRFLLLGRADSVVKVGGRRYSLAEIVQAAQASPDVEQAHAVAYIRYSETAVALFVVPKRGTAPAAADVRAFLSTRLAAFKVPRTIRVVSELPSRGIGKVDEGALRDLAASDDEAAGSAP